MNRIFFIILLCASSLFSQENSAERIFNELRALHIGGITAKAFTAKLSPESARRLLKDKIAGKDWFVEVKYSLYTGIELKIKGADPFYENALAQHEQHINEMLLPLLATRGYERFRQQFVFSQTRTGGVSVGFKKGDINAEYVFHVGDNGLVRRLDYYEDKSRKYAVGIQWLSVSERLIPSSIKAVSYEGSRVAGDFDIIEPIITEK
ncbi:MAG: hypothetical protein ACRCY4_02240 [Brevinema sp.]